MKSVLISIKPKWCEFIASGKKTVEVRKTKPKLDTPFKCYIYCTKDFYRAGDGYFQGKYCGKVIGEFVCDNIFPMWPGYTGNLGDDCLTFEEEEAYLQKGGYGWHISHLTIYDKPKDLSEFWMKDKCPYSSDEGCTYKYHLFSCRRNKMCGQQIERPPQSWCYVEELKE